MDKGAEATVSIDPTFTQTQTDLNYLCSKVKVDADELPQVANTVQRIERALMVLRRSDSVIGQNST
jgi:hypothetical protein